MDKLIVCPRCLRVHSCQYHGVILHCGEVHTCATTYCPNKQDDSKKKHAVKPVYCASRRALLRHLKTAADVLLGKQKGGGMNGREVCLVVCRCGKVKCHTKFVFSTTAFSVFIRRIYASDLVEDIVAIEILEGQCPDCAKEALNGKGSLFKVPKI